MMRLQCFAQRNFVGGNGCVVFEEQNAYSKDLKRLPYSKVSLWLCELVVRIRDIPVVHFIGPRVSDFRHPSSTFLV